MLEDEERVVIPVPDRAQAIWFLDCQQWMGRVIPFCVLQRKGAIWLIHARLVQGPFLLDKLYSFDEFEPL